MAHLDGQVTVLVLFLSFLFTSLFENVMLHAVRRLYGD